MRGLISLLVCLASQLGAVAAATLTDVCPVGFCTLNGGTSGGKGGATVTVSTLEALESAVTGNDPRIVVVSGTISGAKKIFVGSNKSIIGRNGKIVGIGLSVVNATNVIIRNTVHQYVLATYEDAITIKYSTNVWVDHVDLSNDRDHDKDFYDGLVDVTRASDFVTISNSYLHDHWKGSLVGHSDNNQAEDSGHLRVTYANNHFFNLYSRGPMFRIGTGHLFNNYWNQMDDGVRTRAGAQLLIESCVFENTNDDIIAKNGYAVVRDVDLGIGTNESPAGTLTSVPYTYTLLGSANVKAAVVGVAGATLTL
ncbi:polysaccharide lyase family 1 protein [Macroventuria anomochaeta]|uniref:Polysaccharide lyase family 1 protein n=1 Tax=Macroventuria anomochaeta TaxID=301207 RepID=A0ACB6RTN8_9PLEO|nr:polysaccharide lyase family 1 protein [Macroventuria anomochaeta]KAF2625431.1 polysaccharide lyase family 1 protein [Macroventuria anomochaeta]